MRRCAYPLILVALGLLVALALKACSEGASTAPTTCETMCGPHTTCLNNICGCMTGWMNCNQSPWGAGTDGCECQGTCDPTTRACITSSTTTCNRSIPHQCGASKYCSTSGTCLPCPTSLPFNCDGKEDCECGPAGCNGYACAQQTACSPATTGSCNNQQQYCTPTGECMGCTGTERDCNGLSNDDCECPNGCNGDDCVDADTCNPADRNPCNSQKEYCSQSTNTCVSCGTRFDCDGYATTVCECEFGCDGFDCIQGGSLWEVEVKNINVDETEWKTISNTTPKFFVKVTIVNKGQTAQTTASDTPDPYYPSFDQRVMTSPGVAENDLSTSQNIKAEVIDSLTSKSAGTCTGEVLSSELANASTASVGLPPNGAVQSVSLWFYKK